MRIAATRSRHLAPLLSFRSAPQTTGLASPSTFLTASYDGTLRLLDWESLYSSVVAATEDDDAIITAADCKDGHTVFYSDSLGGVSRLDLREKPAASAAASAAAPSPAPSARTRRAAASAAASADAAPATAAAAAAPRLPSTHTWPLHDRKIAQVEVHPLEHHLLVTASLDRTVRLWDLRGTRRVAIAELPHDLAVTGATFSPGTGASLLTTSYDNHIRVFTTADVQTGNRVKPAVSIRHNNQTGRWVTSFRATWLPWSDEPAFVVGNMGRQLDVFSAVDGRPLAALASSMLGTIPAVTVAHPTEPVIAGGVASGRCYLFRAAAPAL